MKSFLLLTLLTSTLNFAWAGHKSYLEAYKCQGKMHEGGELTPTKFTLMVEEDFYCGKDGEKFQALVLDNSQPGAIAALGAEASYTEEATHFVSNLEAPGLGVVMVLSFEISGKNQAKVIMTELEEDGPIANEYTFSCRSIEYHMDCGVQ